MYRSERAAMCHDAGRLVGVGYGTHRDTPGLVETVILDFEAGSWSLTVDSGDDTVVIATADAGAFPDGFVVRDAPAGSPWASALGASVQWAWVLENQQGYCDGLQFGFAVDGKEVCWIQLVAAASAWRIRTCVRVPEEVDFT